MAEYLISSVMDNLVSIIREQATRKLNLVTGVDEEAEKISSNLKVIKAVIEDAERKQVHEAAIQLWLHNLKDISYDIDDVLVEWNSFIFKQKMKQQAEPHFPRKVWCAFTDLSCFCIRKVVSQHEIAIKIEQLNSRLGAIANQRKDYNLKSEKGSHEQREITTSIINESEVLMREEDTRKIKEMLLYSSSQETCNFRPISIVGMGGIGKTTLARLAYNDAQVIGKFDVRIWVCVSDPFEEERVAIEILESLLGEKPNLVGKNNILQDISKLVSGKKILLVLDDVWTEDSKNWEQLKGSLKTASPGSRILVTTRKQRVAMNMGCIKKDMFPLGELPEEKCWQLFRRLAFFGRTREECTSLEDIGRKIVKRCKGLPLAVKVVGGVLRFRDTKEQWQCILDSELWRNEEVEKDLFPPLLLSYYDLRPDLRQCFSYCAIFPKGQRIEKKKLINLWMAQGFLKQTQHENMEITGEEVFNKLAMLSFFQDFERHGGNTIYNCKMHDLVHDFAQFLTAKECLLMDIDGMKSWEKPPSQTIRHLTITGSNETVGISMEDWKKLRTLLIKKGGGSERILDSIDHLTCLRALDLSWSGCRKLTENIGKVAQLRYLNLSGNKDLELLPEALCDLYNLQSLDISRCTRLKELPRGMGKLFNLVYLENWSTNLSFMPKGMERLTNLRTLKVFVVSSGGDGENESCTLEGLGKLTNLQGYLRISGLGNVAKSSEAKEAKILANTRLCQLNLQFDSKLTQRRKVNESHVLEALQPPSCLENLQIWNFQGPPLFPNWMMSLTMLKTVALIKCHNWETLPPLGKLPLLQQLYIKFMNKVRKVGQEFLGMERGGQTSSNISDNSIGFPKLNRLEFYGLHLWEEWEYEKLSTSRGKAASSCCFTIMPCLRYLVIQECPLLKMLPHHILQNPTIQISDSRGKPIPKEHFKKKGNLPRNSNGDANRQST